MSHVTFPSSSQFPELIRIGFVVRQLFLDLVDFIYPRPGGRVVSFQRDRDSKQTDSNPCESDSALRHSPPSS